MALVTLVSGGLDSTLMALLAEQQGIRQFPLFVDYGQRCCEREWSACQAIFQRLGLPPPVSMDLRGYGRLISSGLTSASLRVNEDAFLPGRNLLLLLVGCAYACEMQADAVAIGLLTEQNRLFPDQSAAFLQRTESLMHSILYHRPRIVAPLIDFSKYDVLQLARNLGITGTYSCHSGTATPCGVCVSCLETIHALE